MNLFRSEEHVCNWAGFKAGTDEGILPVADIMTILSTPRHGQKLNGRYVSTCADFVDEFLDTIKSVTSDSAFWQPATKR